MVADEIRALAEDSKLLSMRYRKLPEVVLSVEDLSPELTGILNFIDKTVISDYASMVNISDQHTTMTPNL